jgi:Na+/H+ antiporter NhaD/arsenite permease-like protein
MDASHAVPLYAVLPFALLLLAVAVLPLAAGHWWHANRNKTIVATAAGLPVAIWLLATGRTGPLLHAGQEYVSFVVLLGSLFVVSGGVCVEGDLRGTPRTNTAILALGGLLASAVGTTGASMLLIRPLLRANAARARVVHTVIFFIFVVSNCGGLLTPLGDPPLFIGYLRGVPFDWTFTLLPEWAAVNLALLAIYFVWDTLAARGETPAALGAERTDPAPLRLSGAGNLALLAGVVACVAFITAPGTWWIRDGVMTLLALASLRLTPTALRERNGFDWHPIQEVAALFAGIFAAMVPALLYLEAAAPRLGVDTPARFFWATGFLSSFLDNAPTYVAFASVACGLQAATHPGVTADDLGTLLASPGGEDLLRAISLGAVFMGAVTYIGNGPNFMVKAIAESSGVRMPSFFGYLARSAAVLIPLFAVGAWFWF